MGDNWFINRSENQSENPKMLKYRSHTGFTLIEIAVVVLLIGITLLFAAPRLPDSLLTDPSKSASRWVILTVKSLKEQSVREHKQFTLHADIAANRFWSTSESMTEEEKQAAEEKSYRLPDALNLVDVEYPDGEKMSSGQVDIRFYDRGYSDRAMLHISDGENKISLQIEPFLSRVKYYDSYVEF
jgi:prepilin-type N-terminal cleavage/methylation domain-containing protein